MRRVHQRLCGDCALDRKSPLAEVESDTRGAVYVEFLIAFLPVLVFFLCLLQLTILFSVRLLTEHAAVNAARAAAVVIGDDGKGRSYNNEDPHQINTSGTSKRRETVRNAALITLAPLILNGLVQNVEVAFPPPDQPDGSARTGTISFAEMNGPSISKVRVRVEAEVACQIAFANMIACSTILGHIFGQAGNQLPISLWTKLVRAEAIYPYQGARYDYPN